MKKRLRTIQPPHPSDRITLEQAIQAWREVEGRTGPAEPEPYEAARPRVLRASKPGSTGARVAADRERPPRRNAGSSGGT